MSRGDHPTTSTVAPGTLTALLREVARSPGPVEERLPVLRPGLVVGRFELVREIGRGGFGVVYEAIDRELGRAVALKAVRMGGNLALKQERLLREAEAAAQLSHPNIVILHDMGRFEHGPYLVMELLRGRSLADRIVEGPLPEAEALAIAAEVCEALAHAHGQGVVHRDLSPGNVFLCADGRVKVLDFGMAQAFGRPKIDGGTRPYMAPEQWTGAPEDERTDVFALGVMLFQMLSGALPFPDARALEGAPAPVLSARDADGRPAALVGRMLARDPEQRPRNAQALRAAIDAARAPAEVTTARGAGPTGRSGARGRAAAALLVAAGIGAGALALSRGASPERSPPAAFPSTPIPTSPPNPTAIPTSTTALTATVAAAASVPARPHPARRPAPATARIDCRDSINALPTPPAESGEGILTVEADPFAEVFVGGRRRGETPAECRVPAGTYAVRAVHPSYGAREARLVVRAGERARWTADFLTPP